MESKTGNYSSLSNQKGAIYAQNAPTNVGWAPPGPAGEAYAFPQNPSCNGGLLLRGGNKEGGRGLVLREGEKERMEAFFISGRLGLLPKIRH